MAQDYRFTWQENQYWGSCEPCTASVFATQVRSASVAWKIGMRQAVERAVREGLPLDEFTRNSDFQKWRIKQECRPKAGEKFAALTTAEQLLQWAQMLKNNLPDFVFAVREFELVPRLDRNGHPRLDKDGQPMMYRRRLQSNILHLSGLFMSDYDHLPFPPQELYERTKAPGFPWKVRLAHLTSSGFGLRLVCEWMVEAGRIADNQFLLARELGVLNVKDTTGRKFVTDNSCVNADRISYCPRMQDIIYIDEDKLFHF
jgi:hypothetical protein